MRRQRQLNIRLSPAERLCLETLRDPGQSQADVVTQLVLSECERRWHALASEGQEDAAGLYATALYAFDHEPMRGWSGRPATPPHPVSPTAWDAGITAQDIALATALAAVRAEDGQPRTVADLLRHALITACAAILQHAPALTTPTRRRCAQALSAVTGTAPIPSSPDARGGTEP